MNFFMRRGCARDSTRGQVPPSETQQSRFSREGCPQSLPRSLSANTDPLYGLEMNLFAFPPKNCLPKFWIFHKSNFSSACIYGCFHFQFSYILKSV